MEKLNLPTDNLYIFLTLGGIILLIFSIKIFYKYFISIQKDIINTEKDIKLLEIDIDYLRFKFDIYKQKLFLKSKYIEKIYKIKFGNQNEDEEIKYEKLIIPENIEESKIPNFILDYNELISMILEEKKESIGYSKNLKIQTLKVNEINVKTKNLKFLTIFFIIFLIFNITLIFIGFDIWYCKHQNIKMRF